MADQLEGEDLARATEAVIGDARLIHAPSMLDPRTDEEKLRWLYQRPHAEYLVSVWDKHDLTCRAELWAWLSHEECAPTHGEGRTLSEALCRLIVAVGGDRG